MADWLAAAGLELDNWRRLVLVKKPATNNSTAAAASSAANPSASNCQRDLLDNHLINFVTDCNLIDYIHTSNHFAKNCVLAIQVSGWT